MNALATHRVATFCPMAKTAYPRRKATQSINMDRFRPTISATELANRAETRCESTQVRAAEKEDSHDGHSRVRQDALTDPVSLFLGDDEVLGPCRVIKGDVLAGGEARHSDGGGGQGGPLQKGDEVHDGDDHVLPAIGCPETGILGLVYLIFDKAKAGGSREWRVMG